MDAPADRRSRVDLERLPARRDGLHRSSRSWVPLLLTNVARSAPLEGAWSGFSNNFVELSRSIQRFLPTGGNTQADRHRLRPELHEHPRQVAAEPGARRHRQAPGHRQDRLLLARGDLRPVHPERLEGQWPACEGRSWLPDDPLLDGTAEAGDLEGTTKIEFTVTPAPDGGSILLSPATPTFVDVPTTPDPGRDRAVLRGHRAPRRRAVHRRRHRSASPATSPGELNRAALRGRGHRLPGRHRAALRRRVAPGGRDPAGRQGRAAPRPARGRVR